MPTLRQILRTDPFSRLLSVFFVLGIVVVVWYAWFRGPAESDGELAAGLWFPLVAVLFVAGLPLRVAGVRRMFRIGRTVVGRLDEVTGDPMGAVVARFSYHVGDERLVARQQISGRGAESLRALCGSTVAVLFDPGTPARAILANTYELETLPKAQQLR